MKDIESIIERVEAREKELSENLQKRFDGTPYGQKSASSKEIVDFVAHMLEEYPFQWWVDEETGEYEFDSAWLATLRDDDRVEGGKEAYKRIERAFQSMGDE